jgi:hypothetical protein
MANTYTSLRSFAQKVFQGLGYAVWCEEGLRPSVKLCT